MTRFLAICLGGAVGTGARYLLSEWAASSFGTAFPWGTFLVNAIGSFLLAVIVYAGVEASVISPTMRMALGAGVMGGFTTYSAFSLETMLYLEGGSPGMAMLYVGATVVVGLGACMAGWAASRMLFGAG
jgi:CrcB protein